MKKPYAIKCEVVENDEFCPFSKGEYLISNLTPKGMCAASFSSIWPIANAMRHSERTTFENSEGFVIVSRPDGWVQFRSSRVSEKTEKRIQQSENAS